MSINYKEITNSGGDTVYYHPKDVEVGFTVEGTLTKVLSKPFRGNTSYTYIIATADGDVGLNGFGMLNKRLQHASPGSQVKVIYDGAQKLEEGEFKGQNSYKCRVFVADAGEIAAAPQPKKPLAKVS